MSFFFANLDDGSRGHSAKTDAGFVTSTARAGAAARRGDPASLSAFLAHAPPTFRLYQRLDHALRRGYVNEAGWEQEFRKGTSSKVGQGGAGGVGFDLGQAEIAQCKTHARNARPQGARGIMHRS